LRTGIHPNYTLTTIHCACGYSFQSRSTKPNLKLDICSHCHPFFTGKQKLVDSAGRVERFSRRFQTTKGKTVRVTAKTRAAKPAAPRTSTNILTTEVKKASPKKKTTDDKKK